MSRLRTSLLLVLACACSPPSSDSDVADASEIAELRLAAVDTTAHDGERAAIETAYERYGDDLVAVEGVRLGPGLPAGLGSHASVGLHAPAEPGREHRVLLSGSVPPQHGVAYRVVGRIVPVGVSYRLAVEWFEELPADAAREDPGRP